MSGGAGSSVHPSGMPERSRLVGEPDVAGVGVEGAASCTRSEKVVHTKTAAAANAANAVTMAVTRRLVEVPEGGAPDKLDLPGAEGERTAADLGARVGLARRARPIAECYNGEPEAGGCQEERDHADARPSRTRGPRRLRRPPFRGVDSCVKEVRHRIYDHAAAAGVPLVRDSAPLPRMAARRGRWLGLLYHRGARCAGKRSCSGPNLEGSPKEEGDDTRTTRMNPNTIAPPIGSYSHAVRVESGDAVWIHVSGQIALDAAGNLIGPGDLRAQTEQVFENLARVLEANGASFADVVRIQTYFTTLDDLQGSREVRARYLPSEPPASTAVQVVALVVPEALIEVDVIAVVPT